MSKISEFYKISIIASRLTYIHIPTNHNILNRYIRITVNIIKALIFFCLLRNKKFNIYLFSANLFYLFIISSVYMKTYMIFSFIKTK